MESQLSGQIGIADQGRSSRWQIYFDKRFVESEYESHLIIDFAKCPREVKDLFDDISDLDYVFARLQVIYKVKLIERQSAIVFDEVQKCPLARQAIKYLVEDGRYDYIETGSLLSIRQNVKDHNDSQRGA